MITSLQGTIGPREKTLAEYNSLLEGIGLEVNSTIVKEGVRRPNYVMRNSVRKILRDIARNCPISEVQSKANRYLQSAQSNFSAWLESWLNPSYVARTMPESSSPEDEMRIRKEFRTLCPNNLGMRLSDYRVVEDRYVHDQLARQSK